LASEYDIIYTYFLSVDEKYIILWGNEQSHYEIKLKMLNTIMFFKLSHFSSMSEKNVEDKWAKIIQTSTPWSHIK
jgi:hypothetical protein